MQCAREETDAYGVYTKHNTKYTHLVYLALVLFVFFNVYKVPLTENRTVKVLYPCHDWGGALH